MQNMIELNGIWWKSAKIITNSNNDYDYQGFNDSGFEQPRFDGWLWLYGIWSGADWYSGVWLNGTWIDGGNWKAQNRVIKISPKSYDRPKRTVSLNYAKYG